MRWSALECGVRGRRVRWGLLGFCGRCCPPVAHRSGADWGALGYAAARSASRGPMPTSSPSTHGRFATRFAGLLGVPRRITALQRRGHMRGGRPSEDAVGDLELASRQVHPLPVRLSDREGVDFDASASTGASAAVRRLCLPRREKRRPDDSPTIEPPSPRLSTSK